MDQGDGGSQRKLATSHRGMTHHEIPAPLKEHSRQGQGWDHVARGAPKGQTLKRRQWTSQECSNEIWDQNLKEQLHLRKDRISGRIFRKIVELEVMK
jgi:hypothetical protein